MVEVRLAVQIADEKAGADIISTIEYPISEMPGYNAGTTPPIWPKRYLASDGKGMT